MRNVLSIAVLLACAGEPAFAQSSEDEIIVTASRSGDGVRRDLLGASVTTFSADEMRERQVRVLADVLFDAPSSNVSRQGGYGGLTAARLRGSEGNHTLVLIDGIEANDPFQGEFDFAALITDEDARVEILRGQQSALYGSDAIGGVVHYISASGRESPGVSARFEAGSFETLAAGLRVAGAADRFEGAVTASIYDTEGDNISRTGSEDDGYVNRAISARGSFAASDALSFRGVVRSVHSEGDFDDASFGAPVDSLDTYAYNARYGLVGADLSLLEGAWTHALTLQYVDAQRRDRTSFPNFVDGTREKASYVTAYRINGNGDLRHTFTGAIDYERETYQNVSPPGLFTPASALQERVLETTGYVAAYDLGVGRFGLGLAVRHDSNSRFDDATTYRAQASYRATDFLRLRGAYGTGVKNPTNYELFGFDPPFFIGNLDLEPEESRGWEIGADLAPLSDDSLEIGLTYFSAELENEITGGFFSSPVNLATTSEQQGVEATLDWKLGENWRLEASYAWLDAEQNGVTEIRRPETSGSFGLFWRADGDRGGAGVIARHNGEVTDDDFATFPATRVTLDGFTLVNLTGDWRIGEHAELFARVDNATDETYEQVVGFRGQGRAAVIGVRVRN